MNEKKSRVDVTRFICAYIKEHELQNPKDKRYILPDEKLTKLLNYDGVKPVRYCDLQTYLKSHYS